MRRKVTRQRKKSTTSAAPARRQNVTEPADDKILVPRGFIANAVQALTTKPEFIRTEALVVLVAEFNKILAATQPMLPPSQPPPKPPPKQDQSEPEPQLEPS
jgi:hypothetical protein